MGHDRPVQCGHCSLRGGRRLYVSASDNAPSPDRFGGFGMPIVVGWLGAAVVSGLLSWAVGALTIRLRADYLAIATFGVAVTIQLCVLTCSHDRRSLRYRIHSRPFAAWQENALAFSLGNLAIMMVLVVLALYLGLQHLAKSPWGRVLRAIREDEVAAQGWENAHSLSLAGLHAGRRDHGAGRRNAGPFHRLHCAG